MALFHSQTRQHMIKRCLTHRLNYNVLFSRFFLKQKNNSPNKILAYPDEMLPYTAFHLGLHCLSKILFTSIQIEKGYYIIYMYYLVTSIFNPNQLCTQRNRILKSEPPLFCTFLLIYSMHFFHSTPSFRFTIIVQNLILNGILTCTEK